MHLLQWKTPITQQMELHYEQLLQSTYRGEGGTRQAVLDFAVSCISYVFDMEVERYLV